MIVTKYSRIELDRIEENILTCSSEFIGCLVFVCTG